MRFFPSFCLLLPFLCPAPSSAEPQQPSARAGFVEGRDYLILERHRFLDQARFDRPVESFSLLFPKGWQVQGGVKWLGINECRGDIVSNQVKASSTDGSIKYEVFPSRSFNWSDDQMMQQLMRTGAQNAGCQLNQPFDAARYIEGFARRDLGATSSNIRPDESKASFLQQLDNQANATARQFGNGTRQTSTMAFGDLAWPDGSQGILHVGVTNILMQKPDAFSGRVQTISTTSVYYCVSMRFPAARRAEATRLFAMIQASYRQNPIWKQAKERFLTNLGNMEHAGRMETIRLMGEQARAYAKAQNDAANRQMRDWESQQASQDRQHKTFVQTIREVETWREPGGSVELSSGFGRAWTHGDGSYILSNAPGFDPSSAFQDQRWQEMKRANP